MDDILGSRDWMIPSIGTAMSLFVMKLVGLVDDFHVQVNNNAANPLDHNKLVFEEV